MVSILTKNFGKKLNLFLQTRYFFQEITLIENDEVITEEKILAEELNNH